MTDRGKDCTDKPSTWVVSVSYGVNENQDTMAHQRECLQFGKLSMLGFTFVYASMDGGVAGVGGQCQDPSTRRMNDGSSGRFLPNFPASCPYVL